MQIAIKLQQLFKRYQQAFIHYELDELCRCYHLPCTLNTPDKIVLLASGSDCHQEFNRIFKQLKDAKISQVIAKKATFEQVSKALYLVCIDWHFIDGVGEVFSEFTAIYHVLETDETLKIVNVVSHELENSLTLAEPLYW